MKLYTEKEQYKIYHGNMLDMLEVIEPNSITSSVYAKRDLLKCLGKLKRQLLQCEHYLGERVIKC